MIPRILTKKAKELFTQYPILTITGPRQSGKTTLVKMAFPQLEYRNLEDIETRTFAIEDPKGFIHSCKNGTILDEIQNAPGLLSYIQVYADSSQREGLFVLTGSRHFELMESVTQSLAGRTALLQLLPFSFEEIYSFYPEWNANKYIYQGFYPRIYDKNLDPTKALADYYSTYVERDIRKLSAIHNLHLFHKFTSLCAGRIGQILNLSSLASDVGISHTTAREWLTLLEASYIVFTLQPYYANIGKRLVKSPKLYFYDPGLAAYLLGIEEEKHVAHHPLRGNLFENMVIAEIVKYRFNRGLGNNLSFFRDSRGNEIDCLYIRGNDVVAIEIKSAQTFVSDFLKPFEYFEKIFGKRISGKILVYDGDTDATIRGVQLMRPYRISSFLDSL